MDNLSVFLFRLFGPNLICFETNNKFDPISIFLFKHLGLRVVCRDSSISVLNKRRLQRLIS